VLKHELSQAQINDTLYHSTLVRLEWCRENGVEYRADPHVQVLLKTCMTRMSNQAKRLSIVDLHDPDWDVYKAVRAQDITRTRELLEIWEPIEEHHRRVTRERRQELAVQGRRR